MSIRLNLAKRLRPLEEPVSTEISDAELFLVTTTYGLVDLGIAKALPLTVNFSPVSHPSQELADFELPRTLITQRPVPNISYPEPHEIDHVFTTSSNGKVTLLEESGQDCLTECQLTIPLPKHVEFTDVLAPSHLEDLIDFLDSLIAIPPVETLLDPLEQPRSAGTRFREFLGTEEKTQRAFVFDISIECRHGMPRDLCGICQEEREKRAAKRRLQRETGPVVEDVFQQLWYILQPPILKPLGQPTIFPNGNRPYDFQIAGVHWLVERKAALLADEMGLGKTIQAIIAMRVLFRKGELQRTLVVCPASLTINWEKELKSWAPDLRAVRVHGSKSVRAEAWKAPAEVYIVSYETLANDADTVSLYHFNSYVLDEVQKIKTPTTNNHKAVKTLNPKWRWALSGTPIENSIDDAIAIFSVLVPELFGGTYWESSTETVRKRITPYTLRRSIEDSGLDFPELVHQEHWLELTYSQRHQYDTTENSGVELIRAQGDSATRIHILALISKLKQICNYDEDSGASCKLDFLKERLEVLAAKNEKALVFSQYPIKTLRQIEPELQEFRPLFFDGSLSDKVRNDTIQTFQHNEENQVLLMSIKAGGTGLTLTRANHVFHFDHWWNPAAVDQGTARIYRIGQEKPVFAHSLYASDTVEERIAQILGEKRQTFKAVFGAELDDKAMERLTDEDLFGLFDLKPPEKRKRDEETLQGRPASSHPRPSPPSPRENSKFADMTPVEFEEAICALFERLGYRLQLTQRTRDGGVDLDGNRLGLGGGRVIVQCKRYSGTVPVNVVREFFGVMSGDNNVSEGFVVTTGKFSSDAKDEARGKRITLIDGVFLTFLWDNHMKNGK